MGWLRILVLILLSSSSFNLLPCCFTTCQGILKQGNSITGNQTLVSASGTFALRFFSYNSNTYLGIWFFNILIPNKTVIWVANRESPIPNNSPAVLVLGDDGNLLILDGERKIWSSNIVHSATSWSNNANTSTSTSSTTTSSLVLLDTGNLVLRHGHSNDDPVWQSFDYPTDTLVPDMKFGLNRRTGEQRRLVSWENDNDPGLGVYSLGIDPKGTTQFYITKQQHGDPYWRSNAYHDSLSESMYIKSQGFTPLLTYVVEDDEVYIIYSVSSGSTIRSFFKLLTTGQLQLVLWRDSAWVVLWQVPQARCDFYDVCGPFASCENNESLPSCECLAGFEPKIIQNDSVTGNWTGGCLRRKRLSCDQGEDGFLKFQRMKLPDYSFSIGNMSVSSCESRCLANCSCTAYAYANVSRGGGLIVNCINWFGDLIDLVHDHRTGQDLFVRLHDSELVGSGAKGKLTRKKGTSRVAAAAAAAATGAIGLLIIVSFAYTVRRKRSARQEKLLGNLSGLNAMSSTHGFVQNDKALLSFSLKSVLIATENFSQENKLGEGGFGPVYKGYFHDNQVAAIKRLSRNSLQGLEEFMNELELIAKLQHTNLVRLLGCCVEDDEKILIYEYMPNRSLDKFLFGDVSKQASLDWRKRFKIIEGVAQGLLYLHKYSRLKVIHRDLKASNILLDQAMVPKISDFGMARIFGMDQTKANTNRVVGTYGYMSPEYALFGQFSDKSDVFSFGVLLLEIVSGKRSTNFHRSGVALTLLGWAWENWKEGRAFESIDPSMRETCQAHQEAVLKCIKLGLLCVQEVPNDRPTMFDVVVMLSNESAVIPSPKEPAFSIHRSSTTTTYSDNEMTISAVEPR